MIRTIPAPVRAWARPVLYWTAAIAAACVGPATVLLGVILVLNWGTFAGLLVAMTLFGVWAFLGAWWLIGRWEQ